MTTNLKEYGRRLDAEAATRRKKKGRQGDVEESIERQSRKFQGVVIREGTMRAVPWATEIQPGDQFLPRLPGREDGCWAWTGKDWEWRA